MEKTMIDKALEGEAGRDGIHFPLVMSDFTGKDYEIADKMTKAAEDFNRELKWFKVKVVGRGDYGCMFAYDPLLQGSSYDYFVSQFFVDTCYEERTREVREEAYEITGWLLDTAKRLKLLEIRKG